MRDASADCLRRSALLLHLLGGSAAMRLRHRLHPIMAFAAGVLLGFLLAAFSGVFLSVGAGHLLPEAQHRRPGASPLLVLLTVLGAALVLAVRSVLG